MNHYLRKQITIICVLLLIVLAIGLGAYLLFNPSHKATCYDGVKNQSEEGIDCGGPCGLCHKPLSLKVVSETFIPTIENNFDLIAEIENINPDWGVESVDYRFNLYDEENQLIGYLDGSTYLLPQETKYIIGQKFYSTTQPASASFEIKNPLWQKLQGFEELQIRVRDKNYAIVDNKYRLSGALENKSNYNLDTVEIVGLLFDENKKIIAAGKTNINTFLIGENRSFEINWPFQTDKQIVSSEVKIYTNIFQDDNFMKVHATPEKFKEY